MSKWDLIGADLIHEHIMIYTQKLYGVHFKRIFKVVLLLNTKTQKYVLLASSDARQEARQIVRYYQLRFQIEFISGMLNKVDHKPVAWIHLQGSMSARQGEKKN